MLLLEIRDDVLGGTTFTPVRLREPFADGRQVLNPMPVEYSAEPLQLLPLMFW